MALNPFPTHLFSFRVSWKGCGVPQEEQQHEKVIDHEEEIFTGEKDPWKSRGAAEAEYILNHKKRRQCIFQLKYLQVS